MVPPMIVKHPSQSIAFNPAKSGVFGVSMSRKEMMMAKAMASIGTKGPVSFEQWLEKLFKSLETTYN